MARAVSTSAEDVRCRPASSLSSLTSSLSTADPASADPEHECARHSPSYTGVTVVASCPLLSTTPVVSPLAYSDSTPSGAKNSAGAFSSSKNSLASSALALALPVAHTFSASSTGCCSGAPSCSSSSAWRCTAASASGQATAPFAPRAGTRWNRPGCASSTPPTYPLVGPPPGPLPGRPPLPPGSLTLGAESSAPPPSTRGCGTTPREEGKECFGEAPPAMPQRVRSEPESRTTGCR